MVGLQDIQNFVNGKDVLLVGNAELPEIDLDKYLIVRMNYGMKGGEADIWLNNICQNPKVHQGLNRNQKYILRLNGERNGQRFLLNYPEELKSRTYFWNKEEWAKMVSDLSIDRPLTGTIGIYWFLKYTKLKSLTITGFDFFETKNVYAGTDATKVHNVEKDKEWTRKQINQGRLKWI
jgi:hypothetical protein